MQVILNYKEWRKFEEVINKAKNACINSNIEISEHFVAADKLLKRAINAEVIIKIKDYQLSRYACYLIAQNVDSRKEREFYMNSIELAKYIASMVQNGDYIAGHSIFHGRINYLDKILTDGLVINDASQGLSFTSRLFMSDFADNLLNLEDLSEVSLGIVVIISIPQELIINYDGDYSNSNDISSIVLEYTGESSDIYKDIYGNPTKIAKLPARYILGYLDVLNDTFINNPNYAFVDSKKNKALLK